MRILALPRAAGRKKSQVLALALGAPEARAKGRKHDLAEPHIAHLGAGIRAHPSNTQCIGQNRKESRKILIGWLQKHRLPIRFCPAFLVRTKTLQATHNVGLFPPRRCKICNAGQFPARRRISDVRLFSPRSCNVRPFPPGRHRDASSREEAPLP